jgi:hypothetical protein
MITSDEQIDSGLGGILSFTRFTPVTFFANAQLGV